MGRKGRRMEGEEESSKGETIPNSPAPQYCRGPPDSEHSLGCQLLPQRCFISDECSTACIHALPLLMLEVLLQGSISISFTSPTHKLTHTHTHTHICVSLHIQIYSIYINIKSLFRNAPSSPVVKNLPISAEDMSLIPGPEGSTCLLPLLVKPESPRGHALRQEKPPQ